MKPLLVASVLAFALGAGTSWQVQARLAPRLDVRVDTLVQDAIRLDTLYRVDTIRLRRAKTVYDTARVTDTVVRGDTVFVPREAADEAIAACTASVATCEARLAVAQASEQAAWDSVSRIPPAPDVKKIAGVSAAVAMLLTLLLAR